MNSKEKHSECQGLKLSHSELFSFERLCSNCLNFLFEREEANTSLRLRQVEFIMMYLEILQLKCVYYQENLRDLYLLGKVLLYFSLILSYSGFNCFHISPLSNLTSNFGCSNIRLNSLSSLRLLGLLLLVVF